MSSFLDNVLLVKIKIAYCVLQITSINVTNAIKNQSYSIMIVLLNAQTDTHSMSRQTDASLVLNSAINVHKLTALNVLKDSLDTKKILDTVFLAKTNH
jgi:hypothetical protein